MRGPKNDIKKKATLFMPPYSFSLDHDSVFKLAKSFFFFNLNLKLNNHFAY